MSAIRAPLNLPDEVLAALRGGPVVGDWDPMFPLLTVDEAGYPHVCLLSRSELDARPALVVAVVVSPRTTENLRRDGRAALMVVVADAAFHCKLRMVWAQQGEHDQFGVAFEIVSVKRDGIGIPLEPPRFLVTGAIQWEEHWESSRRLLDCLLGGGETPLVSGSD